MPPPLLLRALQNRRAFTLVELSVVLIIIGLLVGGLIVAQELVQLATVRRTLAQYESFNTAVNSFAVRYGGMPGDLRTDLASAFGFVARDGSFGNGNGDGLISSVCNSASASRYRRTDLESLAFWHDLASARLIDWVPSGDPALYFSPCNLFSETQSDGYLPRAALSTGATWAPFEDGSANNYLLAKVVGMGPPFTYSSASYAVSAAIAARLDQKADDGAPLSGNVMAADLSAGMTTLATPQLPAAGACVTDESGYPYNVSTLVLPVVPQCGLRLRFQ